jgi:Na+/pantothenate symporter
MYERARQFTLNTPLLRKLIGIIFLVFGIIFLVTPLTPGGIIITLVGLELLGLEFFLTKKLRERVARRHNDRNEAAVID